MTADPYRQFTDEELETLLDRALAENDSDVVWRIVAEIERRGKDIEV